MELFIGIVLVMIIISATVIIILKRIIFQDTTSAINRLNKLDTMNREKERTLVAKLDETEKYFETRKKELEDEEKRLKLEAQRAANQLQEDIVKKAKIEAEDIVKKAQASKDKMRADAVIEAESKIIDFCREILGHVLSGVVQTQMNEQIIQEFMKELEAADISRVGKDISTVEIATGRSINDETKKIIKSLLDNKLGRPITVTVKEEHELLGGVVMKFGTMVIDGSLREHLREVSEKMKEELSWRHP
mgnify:CR=1 FL=1